MAWTTVPTFTSGQILTAAQMNGLGSDLNELRGDYASYLYTTGNVTLTGTTNWSTLTTIGTAGDLTLAADAGDVVEIAISFLIASASANLGFDAVTVVSGTATNSFSQSSGVPTTYTNLNSASAWFCNQLATAQAVGGSLFYKLVSGDISSGNVTLRVRYVMSSANNATLYATTSNPAQIWARNHGPVEV